MPRPAVRGAVLRRLLDALEDNDGPIPLEVLGALVGTAPLTLNELVPFVRFKPASYARNRIHRSEHFEVLCMCWLSGQRSPIHDHHGSACVVRVMDGVMTNIDFDQPAPGLVRPVRTLHLLPGAVDARTEGAIHEVVNQQQQPATLVTFHVYSPPLDHMTVYRPIGASTPGANP